MVRKSSGRMQETTPLIKQRRLIWHQAYGLTFTLKDLPSDERLQKRQLFIKPLVEDYFAWIREILADSTILPKGKTADGLKYSLNQEKYLKVFLENPDVPIDNSASERSIRTFCIGKKNWMFHNTAKGASSSALVYSISETAKLNNRKRSKTRRSDTVSILRYDIPSLFI